MIRPFALVIATLTAPPVLAQEPDHAALRERALIVLETQFAAFRDTSADLASRAERHCSKGIPKDVFADQFRATWLAWAPLDAYQFGPIEQCGAVLSIGFWPDKKGYVGRGVKNLLTLPAETLSDPATIAQASAAAQGLPAIEYLLDSDLPVCPAVIGLSANLRVMGQMLYDDWFAPDGWADLARAAGPANPIYLSEAEFTKALFTAVDFGLTRMIDLRLGRPLGTFDRPMPRRAEAHRSGLSLDILDTQLAELSRLIQDGLGDATGPKGPEILAEFDAERAKIDRFDAPLDQLVSDPIGRFRVEGLLSDIQVIHSRLATDLGPALGVKSGFSAADGD
ncbi:imelysin family protein [Shimia abyssi]|uniref:Imelysin-like domain-containing protein n=1 Tax=Shimia abyssi TaxID=1662395 RepID=A0A2P8FGP9_9RHOB|nr:imelysin family protein [Shimia abyssi]PSL20906.1 hypothetical protein CLV88_10223 [Shimia abyssi]